jgi:histidine phosphotransfer protein HptB
MNMEKLAKNLEMNNEEFHELMEIFLKSGFSELNKLQCAIFENNSEKAFQAAHSIKGAAINMGLKGLFEKAGFIEKKVCSNGLSNTDEALDALKKEMEIINTEFKNFCSRA